MKNFIYIFSATLLLCCNSNAENKIDLNFLIGGQWCGESELAGGEICIEFLNTKAYLKVKGQRFYNPLDYIIIKRDGWKKTISWEFVGEGTINVFKIISQDTVEFKQQGAESAAKFIRLKI
jgi:hypothetical protein|tara:strand:+ start:87 stop:449 length:363 start_codon:yes stop_codon:yes gene_type:complete